MKTAAGEGARYSSRARTLVDAVYDWARFNSLPRAYDWGRRCRTSVAEEVIPTPPGFWTSRDVREAIKSHVNYVVADTLKWEQSAAFQIDRHPAVDAFVKNAGLGVAIPYLHHGAPHDFVPDFLIRLNGTPEAPELKFRPTGAAIRLCASL